MFYNSLYYNRLSYFFIISPTYVFIDKSEKIVQISSFFSSSSSSFLFRSYSVSLLHKVIHPTASFPSRFHILWRNSPRLGRHSAPARRTPFIPLTLLQMVSWEKLLREFCISTERGSPSGGGGGGGDWSHQQHNWCASMNHY